MQLTTQTKPLITALASLSPLTKGHSLPILGNALITARPDNTATLQATDLDHLITHTLPIAPGPLPGAIAVNCARLLALLRASSATECTITATHVTLAGQDYDLPDPQPAVDFPPFPAAKILFTAALPGPVLRQAIALTLPCASADPSRYVLNGVYLDLALGRMVGTDGRRMALYELPDGPNAASTGVILPTAGAKLILAALKKETGSIAIEISENRVAFTLPGGGQVVSLKCIDSNYPNYTQVIPDKHGPAIVLPREAALAAVRMVRATFPDKKIDKNSSHKWSIRLECPASSTPTVFRLGTQTITLPTPTQCTTPTCLRADYLEYPLAALDTETVNVEYIDELSPAVFTAAELPEFKYIMMPLRMS